MVNDKEGCAAVSEEQFAERSEKTSRVGINRIPDGAGDSGRNARARTVCDQRVAVRKNVFYREIELLFVVICAKQAGYFFQIPRGKRRNDVTYFFACGRKHQFTDK